MQMTQGASIECGLGYAWHFMRRFLQLWAHVLSSAANWVRERERKGYLSQALVTLRFLAC